jgi:CRISPR-associated protein Cmr4
MACNSKSFKSYGFAGMAIDPIHVGTGGTRLGRVDNTIVRDPVTQIPMIPGSSLAGVFRAYTAMVFDKYPECAGPDQPDSSHCCRTDCPVCTVFGYAKGTGSAGGFAGLASFSDMNVLLFPVASQIGPQWITSPAALRQMGTNDFCDQVDTPEQNVVYREQNGNGIENLKLGWLYLPVRSNWPDLKKITDKLKAYGLPDYILSRIGIVSDKLFSHAVNSNLEVRTSVAIDPALGSAKDGALFTYEALPRTTVLQWTLTCRNPNHFRIKKNEIMAVASPDAVKIVIERSFEYIKHLGIGGMSSRGMGRIRMFSDSILLSAEQAREEV